MNDSSLRTAEAVQDDMSHMRVSVGPQAGVVPTVLAWNGAEEIGKNCLKARTIGRSMRQGIVPDWPYCWAV